MKFYLVSFYNERSLCIYRLPPQVPVLLLAAGVSCAPPKQTTTTTTTTTTAAPTTEAVAATTVGAVITTSAAAAAVTTEAAEDILTGVTEPVVDLSTELPAATTEAAGTTRVEVVFNIKSILSEILCAMVVEVVIRFNGGNRVVGA